MHGVVTVRNCYALSLMRCLCNPRLTEQAAPGEVVRVEAQQWRLGEAERAGERERLCKLRLNYNSVNVRAGVGRRFH